MSEHDRLIDKAIAEGRGPVRPVPVRRIFQRCPMCTDTAVVRLALDWQAQVEAGGAIPIIGCGNPWHYDPEPARTARAEAAAGPCSLDAPNPAHEHAEGFACGIVQRGILGTVFMGEAFGPPLIWREARASVSLDHDEREGTHYMGDGHDHGEGPE